LLTAPPRWLPRVVEVSIQARQCIALEIEYCLPPGSEAGASEERSNDDDGTVPAEGLSRPRPSPAQEVAEMHREAVVLAQQLLPDDHPVRSGAERACLQGQDRKSKPRDSPLSSAARRTVGGGSPSMSSGEVKLPAFKNGASMNSTTASTIFSALHGEMGFFRVRQVAQSRGPILGWWHPFRAQGPLCSER